MMTPRIPTLTVLLAACLLATGCPKKGPKNVTLEESQMQDSAYVFSKGTEAATYENWDQAYELYSRAADQLNGGPKAEFNAGWVAERLGKADVAEQHYRDAFNADPTYLAARDSLLRVLRETGKDDQTAAVYEAYLKAKPDDTDARTEYMQALVSSGREGEAIAIGQEILRKNPDSDGVYRALSAMYLQRGLIEMAQITGDKALTLNDKDPDVYNNMGVVALKNGDVPGAIEKFKAARHLDNTHYEASINLGLIAANSGDYTLAQECFTAALERNPSSVDGRIGLAVSLRGLGDLPAAQKIYDDLIKENPKLRIAYFNAATLHEVYTKDYTKAIKYLEAYKSARAGELSPSDDVFKRIEDILAAKAAEEERKRLEAEAKKAEEERKRRAQEILDGMAASVSAMQAKLTEKSSCIPEEVSMELDMFVEMAGEAITGKDTEMAADFKQMLDDYYQPMLDGALAEHCGGAAPAPAPEEGDEAPPAEDDEAPAEDGETAPAEDSAPQE